MDNKNKFLGRNSIAAVLFLLVLVFFLGFWIREIYISKQVEGSVYVVEMRDDGFHPNDLRINKGDTIRFVSSRGVLFWPASNEHPVHSIYREFDPLRPIEPNESWEFTFEKKGVWEFHDHLYSFFGGTITVQ